MFKILFITLITSFFSLQAEEVKTDKQNACIGDPFKIYQEGLAPCKAGDLLQSSKPNRQAIMMRICVLGTLKTMNYVSYCILKKEEDFLEEVQHEK